MTAYISTKEDEEYLLRYEAVLFSKVWKPQRDWCRHHHLPYKEMKEEKKFQKLLKQSKILEKRKQEKEGDKKKKN